MLPNACRWSPRQARCAWFRPRASAPPCGPKYGLRAAQGRSQRSVPRPATAPRDLPERRRASPRRCQPSAVRRKRTAGLLEVRRARARLRSLPLHRLQARTPRAAELQGPRFLSELRRQAHDRHSRAPHGLRHAAGARAPVRVELSLLAALPPRIRPRSLYRHASHLHSRGARLLPAPRTRTRRAGRARRLGHVRAAFRIGGGRPGARLHRRGDPDLTRVEHTYKLMWSASTCTRASRSLRSTRTAGSRSKNYCATAPARRLPKTD